MVDKEVILKKLGQLEQYIKELEKIKSFSLEELSASLQNTWSAEHGLQLAIQVVIDTGNHILAAIGENQIEDYVDVIDKLGKKEIIPLIFAQKIRNMAGFRNILVHEYTKVDLKEVYRVLQEQLNDFREFIQHVKQYLLC